MSLAWAAKIGDVVAIDCLLDSYMPNTNARDSDGRTALLRAVENEHEAVVKRLLACNWIDPCVTDSHGHTPLSRAAKDGLEAMVRLLLADDRINVNNKRHYYVSRLNRRVRVYIPHFSYSPLLLAVENGHRAVAELLLTYEDIDVNARDSSSRTPLYWASKNGHDAVVKLLLTNKRVDINTVDFKDQTPLSVAAEKGHEEVVKLLLNDDRIDVNFQGPIHQSMSYLLVAQNKPDMSPLSLAAQNGHEAVVELLLLDNRVDFNVKDPTGSTPLMVAAKNGQDAMVKLLLTNSRVDVNTKDSAGRTLLSRAIEYGHAAVAKLLLADKRVNVSDRYSDLRLILPVGNLICSQTLLLQAAEKGFEEIVKLILASNRVDVNGRDSTGRTPLFRASMNGHPAVVKLLLGHDQIDVNAEDPIGRTPLDQAGNNGHDEVVKLLLADSRVNMDAKRWVIKHRYQTVAKLLLSDEWADTSLEMPTYLILVWRIILFLMLLARRLETVLRAGISLDRYSEFPNRFRPPCTTMPWNVRPALVVLWGVCWMFYSPQAFQLDDYTEILDYNARPYPDNTFSETFPGHTFPDTPLSSQHAIQQNHNFQQTSLIPGVSHDYTYPLFPSVDVQENPSGNGASEHNRLPCVAGDGSWPNNQFTFMPTEGSRNSNQLAITVTDDIWSNNQLLPIVADGTRDNSQLAPTFTGGTWIDSQFPPALTEGQFNLSSSSQFVHPNLTTSNAIVEAGGIQRQPIVTTLSATTELDNAQSPRPGNQGLLPCNCPKHNGTPQPKAHRDRVEKPFICPYSNCANRPGFGAKEDLNRHINSVHEQSDKFPCPVSGCSRSNRAFLRCDKLKEHIKGQHKDLGVEAVNNLLKNLRASHTPARGATIPAPALRRGPSPSSRLRDTSRGIRKRPRSRGRTSSPESEHYVIEGSRRRRKDKEELDRRIVHIENKLEVLLTEVERVKRELEECKRMAAQQL